MKAIIFDIDGTLVESMAIDTELYFAAVREVLGVVIVRSDLHDYEHVTDAGILAQLLDDNGVPSDSDSAVVIRESFLTKLQMYVDTNGSFSTIHGAKDFFDATCRSDDTRVAIATGCWHESALLKLGSAGFDIDGVPLATCDDSPSRVEIMRAALAGINGVFESITYFGDAVWDRQACDTLGWNFVAVGPGLGGITTYAGFDLSQA